MDVAAPAAGMAADLRTAAVMSAIAVTGTVRIPGVGGGASGVTVQALCFGCAGMQAQLALAEAVTDATGGFTLVIPDPGVE